MFGGSRKKSSCPVGLDVGESGVRMLQVTLRGGRAQAIAAASASLPEGLKPADSGYAEALASAIRSAWSGGGFTTNRVVSALPASSVQCKNLRLPAMPADELASAVEWEAADRFRMGEGQCSVQFLNAGQVSQGDEVRQELILLAARLAEVEAHVTALTAAGLRPVAIDAVPTSLARLSALRGDNPSALADEVPVNVIIDVGQSATKVLIESAGQVRFYKPIEIGVEAFESVLCGALSIKLDEARDLRLRVSSEDETDSADGREQDRKKLLNALEPTLNELAREIGLCLRYYGVTFRGARPGSAEMVGGGAAPWLAEALSESAGMAFSLDPLLQKIDLSAVRREILPSRENAWAVSAGLSVRDHVKLIDPRFGEESQSGDSVFDRHKPAKGVAA
ncbi:MAG: pilus assembly protein PilM [Planctomycetota bacterium]